MQRKMAVVARLLRGEPLDVVAREANVSVAKLTEWRDQALAGRHKLAGESLGGESGARTPFCLSSGDSRGVDLPASLSDEGEDLPAR